MYYSPFRINFVSEDSYHHVPPPIETAAKTIATMPVVHEKESKPEKKERENQSQNVLKNTQQVALRPQKKRSVC